LDWRRLAPTVASLLLFIEGCGNPGGSVLEEVSEKVYTIDPDASINIQNRDGAVLVYAGAADEIRVRFLKRAYSQKRLNQIGVDISVKPGAASIVTKFPPQAKWGLSDRSGTVDYTVVVPATASISSLDANAGEVLLDSMRGAKVRARLNDGRMFARDCFTNLDLEASRGTLTLTYDWWAEEKFAALVKVRKGNAWVFLPGQAAFHLFAEVAHGNIANDFNDLPVSAKSSQQMRIDQIINGGGTAKIAVRVDKGRIKIAEANP
jgi:hypothetical protein